MIVKFIDAAYITDEEDGRRYHEHNPDAVLNMLLILNETHVITDRSLFVRLWEMRKTEYLLHVEEITYYIGTILQLKKMHKFQTECLPDVLENYLRIEQEKAKYSEQLVEKVFKEGK